MAWRNSPVRNAVADLASDAENTAAAARQALNALNGPAGNLTGVFTAGVCLRDNLIKLERSLDTLHELTGRKEHGDQG